MVIMSLRLSSCKLTYHIAQHDVLFDWLSFLHHVSEVRELKQCSLSLQWHLGLICSNTHTYVFRHVQGKCRILRQNYSSKGWIPFLSVFLIVQLSHPCDMTEKTMAWTSQIFVYRDTSLHLRILSKLFMADLPRSIRHQISWLLVLHYWLLIQVDLHWSYLLSIFQFASCEQLCLLWEYL